MAQLIQTLMMSALGVGTVAKPVLPSAPVSILCMMRPSCDDSEVCVCRGGVVNFHVFVFRRTGIHSVPFFKFWRAQTVTSNK